MKTIDVDRVRSEETRSLASFCEEYNTGLPETFSKVSKPLLEEFRRTHPEAFKTHTSWTLDQHRKKVMDWLRVRPA